MPVKINKGLQFDHMGAVWTVQTVGTGHYADCFVANSGDHVKTFTIGEVFKDGTEGRNGDHSGVPTVDKS